MAESSVPSKLTHKFAAFNPFRGARDEGGEEQGEVITGDSVAGGGRRAENRKGLHVSHAIRTHLADLGVIGAEDVGDKQDDAPLTEAMQKVLEREPIKVPAYVNDRSHSLSEYYISSSVSRRDLRKSSESGIHASASSAHTLRVQYSTTRT